MHRRFVRRMQENLSRIQSDLFFVFEAKVVRGSVLLLLKTDQPIVL